MPTYTSEPHSFLIGRDAPRDFSEGAILANTWRERNGRGRIDTV